jgi:hypothetical protein
MEEHPVWGMLDDASINFAGTLLGVDDSTADLKLAARAAIIKFLAKPESSRSRSGDSDSDSSDNGNQPQFFALAAQAGVEGILGKEPEDFFGSVL